MTSFDTDARAGQRREFCRNHLGVDTTEPERASADAGFRSYWRVQHAHGTAVLMDSPPDKEDVRPWLAMHDTLQAGGVRVPQVLARDVDAGLLLLEDLGGPTLLQSIDADSADLWFERAFDQLLAIQSIQAPAILPIYGEAMVLRELSLFPDWFLRTHLGLAPSQAEQRILDHAGALLAANFAVQPQGLVHRDFMPRNLMPLSDGVAVLDFQDAVRGPLAYDVLSLFKDAFLSWPPARIDAWLTRWAMRSAEVGRPLPDDFRRQFELTGVQRHLKVLGIFARLQHRDGKPRYLADAPRFLAYLNDVLPRHPELGALHTMLRERVFPRLAPMPLPQ